mgnify:FL=1
MIKNIFRYISIFSFLLVGYIVFGLAAWCLPDRKIQDSITLSVEKGDIDMDYPRAIVNKEMCRMDNCTDALILNQSYCAHIMPPIQSVMLVPSVGGETRNVEALEAVVAGMGEPVQTYARYWHGSTFLMRFLLLIVGRYANIRLVLYYISSITLVIMLAMASRHSATKAAVAFIVAFLLLKGYVLQFSIQFFPVLMLACCGGIAAIFFRSSPRRMQMAIFVVGSLTAYFDLLTTPLLTIGVPLLIYIACNEKKLQDMSIWELALTLLTPLVIWGIGYGCTWMAKWALATCFTSENVFASTLTVGQYRINGAVPQMGDYTIGDTFTSNIRKMPLILVAAAIAVLALLATLFHKRMSVKLMMIYMAVGLLPYLWFAVLANHSWVHCWFTYRAQMVTVMAVVMVLSGMVDWSRLYSMLKRRNP